MRSDTTLAQLHLMIQILFAWGNEHLHHFHVFGQDYGSNSADTQTVMLNRFGFRHGERFRYVYNYYAQWQCDIRLEATLPFDPKRFYPMCTGGKRPAPPEHVQNGCTVSSKDGHPRRLFAVPVSQRLCGTSMTWRTRPDLCGGVPSENSG